MNKDRVNGTIDEMAGSAKRKAGGLSDDIQLQVEGVAQQVKGKVESAWGKAKDAVREAKQKAGVQHDTRAHVDGKETN